MRQYVVFRHLLSVPTPHGPSRESVRPVLSAFSGEPVIYDDERSAYAAAEHMQKGNAMVGRDHCSNVRYTAGWLGERS